jgi:hypothetical protein
MAKVEHTSDARILLGIDISKHRHEVLIAVPGKTRRRRLTITNSTDYFMRLIAILREYGMLVRIGFEATGNYHRVLMYHLGVAGFDLKLVSSVTRFTDLLDPPFQLCRIGAAGFVVVARAVELQGATRPADGNRSICAHPTNQFARPFRLQSFCRTRSVRAFTRTNGVHTLTICRSNVGSATIRFNRAFSSSSCFSRRISSGRSPPYFFFHAK